MSKSKVVTIDPNAQANRGNCGSHGLEAKVDKMNIELKLEPHLWRALEEICWRQRSSIHAVCTAVYMTRTTDQTLEMAMRHFIFDYFRCAVTEEGHRASGHGLDIQTSLLPNYTLH